MATNLTTTFVSTPRKITLQASVASVVGDVLDWMVDEISVRDVNVSRSALVERILLDRFEAMDNLPSGLEALLGQLKAPKIKI